jgi:hypothetical protein
MPAERLLPIFEGLGIAVVVCGHTRMQFDRIIGTTRVVNAGSVGKPFGKPGADWLLLAPDGQFRRRLCCTQRPRAPIREKNTSSVHARRAGVGNRHLRTKGHGGSRRLWPKPRQRSTGLLSRFSLCAPGCNRAPIGGATVRHQFHYYQ